MNFIKKLSFAAVRKIGLGSLLRLAPQNLFIPFQHIVSDEPVPWIESLYKFKNTRQFEADIDFLLSRFTPVSLADLSSSLESGTSLPANSFLLTFDDAFRQVHEIIMPILLKKGVPAALFIVPAFLDNKELFYDLKKGLILEKLGSEDPGLSLRAALAGKMGMKRNDLPSLQKGVRAINYLHRELPDKLAPLLELDFDQFIRSTRPFMTTAMVHDFIKKGFHVGGHSMDHPLYSLISEQEQFDQTVSSVKWVRDTFGLGYGAFAFPHSDKGLGSGFFNRLETCDPDLKPGILFGNTTGMLEKNPVIYHRFIGENPDIEMQTMVRAILCYKLARKVTGNEFIKRY